MKALAVGAAAVILWSVPAPAVEIEIDQRVLTQRTGAVVDVSVQWPGGFPGAPERVDAAGFSIPDGAERVIIITRPDDLACTCSPPEPLAGDVNGDGVIGMADAIWILRILAGF